MGRIILNNEEYTGSSGSAPVTDVTVNGTSVVNAQGVAEVTAVQDNPTFTEAQTRANIASGESFATILGKIKKFFSDLKAVAFTGSYDDLSNKPTIPVGSDYVQKSGDTMTGKLVISRSSDEANVKYERTDTSISMACGIGSAGINHGVWSDGYNDGTFHSSGKWLISRVADGSTKLNGNVTVPSSNGTLALTSDIPDISTKVSKSGDTLTGELEIRRATGVDAQYRSTNTTNGYQISFGWGSGGTNRGIWDTQFNKWIFHSTGTAVYVNGVAFPTTAKLTDTTNQLSNYYSSRPTSCNIQLGDGTLRYFMATSSMSTGKPTGDCHILHCSWDNSGGWDGQIALPTDNSKHMQWRTQTNGTWGAWKTIIDSDGGTISNDLNVQGTLTAYNFINLYSDVFEKQITISLPTSLTANRNVSFPNKGGTIAMTSDISSRRYKENIIPLSEDEAKKILDVEVVNYDYKENVVDEDERYDQKGAIAEDVVNLIPNAVTYADIDGEQLPDGINYTKFIPYLIKMVQMQQKEIDELKAMIKEASK